MRQALDLYQGELLAGLSLEDSPAFESWLLMEREICHRQAVDALQTVIAYHRARQDHADVRALAERLIDLEPYNETAHARLIEALALLGDRNAALAAYHRCVTLWPKNWTLRPAKRSSNLTRS
ncbi:MAG: bacterial transcriptional activator domain-containing protein [Caldilineaceae bacterium]